MLVSKLFLLEYKKKCIRYISLQIKSNNSIPFIDIHHTQFDKKFGRFQLYEQKKKGKVRLFKKSENFFKICKMM